MDLHSLSELTARHSFSSKSDFLNKLYSDINQIITSLENTSDKYFSDDEDKITNYIVNGLYWLGYDASEQTKQVGSVDLTVFTKDRLHKWIGEAKIGYDNTKIFEGLLQLVTRYVKRDENAGLLIYFQKNDARLYFNSWLQYLFDKGWVKYCERKKNLHLVKPCLDQLKKEDYTPNNQYHYDLKIKKPNGDPIEIRVFFADLYHEPADKSGVANKSIKNGQAKNKIREYTSSWFNEDFDEKNLESLFENLKIFLGKDFDPDDVE